MDNIYVNNAIGIVAMYNVAIVSVRPRARLSKWNSKCYVKIASK